MIKLGKVLNKQQNIINCSRKTRLNDEKHQSEFEKTIQDEVRGENFETFLIDLQSSENFLKMACKGNEFKGLYERHFND